MLAGAHFLFAFMKMNTQTAQLRQWSYFFSRFASYESME